MTDSKLKNCKKLIEHLREYFEGYQVSGTVSKNYSTIAIICSLKKEGNNFSKIARGCVSKWTSEDFMHFEKQCKKELK